MKLVPIRECAEFNSPGVFKAVLENPPNGATVTDIRSRCRVLDALDALKEGATSVLLEDADHATLKAAIEAHRFGKATKELLDVLDDVINAKVPPEPEKSAGEATPAEPPTA